MDALHPVVIIKLRLAKLNSPAKIILIGLDSADRNLILKWCESCDLPNLRALQRNGAWGELASEPGVGDDASWASFSTTVSCARHGRFYFRTIEPGSYRTPRFRDHHLVYEPFWAELSRGGNRVAILDVPKCPLVTDLNGVQVTDWLVHGRDGGTRSWPAEMAPEICRKYGEDSTDRWGAGSWLCGREQLRDDLYETFIQRTLHSMQQKLSLAEEVLDRGDWSLFTVVFKEAHCIGHQCWHLLDEGHELFDADMAERLGNPVKRVYMALDTAVGRLLDRAGEDTTTIVFSDLGMGRNYTGEHILDAVLLELERSDSSPWAKARCSVNTAAARVCSRLVRKGGNYLRKYHRRFFQIEHNEISGAIRINLEGREPRGRVRRGREMDELCDWLSRELLDITDPDSGEPVVARVLRTDSTFSGDRLDYLPDLFVIWNRRAPITGAASPTIGELRLGAAGFRTGNHVANGIYFAGGHRITPMAQPCGASIMDIGPTVAALLGTTLENTDGRPLAALIAKSMLKCPG